MAEPVVSFAIQRLGDLLISEAKFLRGVSSEIDKLQVELKRMQCFLRDADKKQIQNERVKNWVAEMRDLAFKTEDVIETFAIDEATKKLKSGLKERLQRFACIMTDCANLHNIGMEIKLIRDELSSLSASLSTYDIKGLEEGKTSNSVDLKNRRIIYFHDVEKDFIGMEKEIEQIISRLINKDNHCDVVSICGMGGQGKTTVAKQIFNHTQVRAHFEAFGSVCISQQFDRIKVLKSILEQLLPEGRKEEVSRMGDEVLTKELYKVQLEKKCLVVIDDIWTMDAWNDLCPAFPIGMTETGGKILLTTRNETVAKEGYVYKLPSLTEEEGWQLLSKKSFSLTTGESPVKEELSKMESIGKEMVVQCKGLPLAVSAMGGMLRGKTLREWQTISRDIHFHLSRGEGIDQYNYKTVTHILGLSYDDLPPCLRQCFLCLSNYKEDGEIDVEQLYLCWLGEGLISREDKAGGTMLEVAERYLNELALRSLVEVEPWEYEGISWSKFKKCRVHDLIRELCLRKVEEEKVIRVIDLECKPHHDLEANNNRVRRLCIRGYDQMDVSFVDENVTPQVRTLFLLSPRDRYPAKNIFSLEKFKLLRVLKVEGGKLSSKNIRSTTKLVYLKYLSFKDCEVEELPSSIGNLRNLETLDLRVRMFPRIRIPNVITKFKQLKHLYLPDSLLLSDNQENLRLDELELIQGFYNRHCNADDLIGLNKLKVFEGRLSLDMEKTITIKDIIDFVKSKELCHSSLTIVGVPNVSSLILLLECSFIDELTIRSRVTALAKEYEHNLSSSGRLTSLDLVYTELDEDSMILLEKLPNLRSLTFNSSSYMGREMICLSMGFPLLQTLYLYGLPNLTNWRVDEGAMPNLSELRVWDCCKWEMLPDGLRFITALNHLDISEMPTTFCDRIKVEGPDFYKIRHIPTVTLFERIRPYEVTSPP